jgi:hypothetical protein
VGGSEAAGGGETGVEGSGGVGDTGGSVPPLAGAFVPSEGLSEASSEGEGLGDSARSPKMFVGPEKAGVWKAFCSRPSCRGCMSFFHICAAGFPFTFMRVGVS